MERDEVFKKAFSDTFGRENYLGLLNFFMRFLNKRKSLRGNKFTLPPDEAKELAIQLRRIINYSRAKKVISLKALIKKLEKKNWILTEGEEIYSLMMWIDAILMHLATGPTELKNKPKFEAEYIENATKLTAIIRYLANLSSVSNKEAEGALNYFSAKEVELTVEIDEMPE